MILGSHWFPRAPIALIGMLGATAVVALFGLQDRGIEVIGEIPAGLPRPIVPDVSLADVVSAAAARPGRRLRRVLRQHPHRPRVRGRSGERIDAKRELSPLGAANLGAGLLQGFPVSSSGSRTAIGDSAVGARSQLAGVVTVVGIVLALLFARPAARAVPERRPGRGRRLRSDPTGRRLGVPQVRALPPQRAGARPGNHRRGARHRRAGGVLVAIGLSVAGPAPAGVATARRGPRLRARLAGMHDIDDYPEATTIPGLWSTATTRRCSSPTPRTSSSVPWQSVADATDPVRWFVLNAEANIEVDITATDALEDLRASPDRARHRVRDGPGQAGPARRAARRPGSWTGSARTACSPPCPPRSRRTREPRGSPGRAEGPEGAYARAVSSWFSSPADATHRLRGRGLPRGSGHRHHGVPRRSAREAAAGRGPGGRRQDRARQGGGARHGGRAGPAPVLRGARRGACALRVELQEAAAAHPGRGGDGSSASWAETHDDIFTEEFLLTRPLLTAIRREEPDGAAGRRGRQDRRRGGGPAAGGALRLPGDHPRARHGRGGAPAVRGADLQRHPRAVRGAQAALPLPAPGLPRRRARAGDRHRPGAGPRRRRSRASSSPWSPGCASWSSRRRRRSPSPSTGRAP